MSRPSLPAQSSAPEIHVHPRAQPGSVDVGALDSSVYGVVGNITTIDPDDAAAAGTLATLARSDHQHPFTSGAASSLTKTASNAEGSSSSHARADHVHATSALPWGIVAREKLTANSSGFTASGATDLNVDVTPDTTRLYVVHVLTVWTITVATARWLFTLTDDASLFARIGDTRSSVANTSDVLHAAAIWEPSSGGSHSVELRLSEVTDGSTMTLNGSASEPRYIWVEDIGPR